MNIESMTDQQLAARVREAKHIPQRIRDMSDSALGNLVRSVVRQRANAAQALRDRSAVAALFGDLAGDSE